MEGEGGRSTPSKKMTTTAWTPRECIIRNMRGKGTTWTTIHRMWDTVTERVPAEKAAGRIEEVKMPVISPTIDSYCLFEALTILVASDDDDVLEDDRYNKKEKVVPKKVVSVP